MGFRAIAAHFAFMAFGVFGGFLAWRWPRLIWAQFLAVTWMVVIVAAHLSCPLTWVEDWARRNAGMTPKPGGFIANYLAGVFFPHGHEPAAMAVTAVVILVSWAGNVLRGRASRPRPPAGTRSRSRRSSPDPTAPR